MRREPAEEGVAAWDAERWGEPRRNEKECNKLAVRLFSTCIKTSSGDGRPGKYCPTPSTPLFSPSMCPHRSTLSPTRYSATFPYHRGPAETGRFMGSPFNDLRPCCPNTSWTEKIMLGLISRRCERAPSEFVNRALWARNKADSKCSRSSAFPLRLFR